MGGKPRPKKEPIDEVTTCGELEELMSDALLEALRFEDRLTAYHEATRHWLRGVKAVKKAIDKRGAARRRKRKRRRQVWR